MRRRLYYRIFGADGALSKLGVSGRVLDVGCSDGRGSELLTGSQGCDIYRPALNLARAEGRRNPVAQADVRRLPYASDSFDLVTALDVLEHFEPTDALDLLREMERVSRGLVVVMTPSGFVPQSPSEQEPWQMHRSGWTASDLRALGYDVRGVGGAKRLRSDYAAFRWGALGAVLGAISSPFTSGRPDLAFHIIGVKSTHE